MLFRKSGFRASPRILLIAALALFTQPAIALEERQDVKEAIVKIYTIHSSPDYYNPWSMRSTFSSTGSGCIVKGKRILTNAHVVSDQTFIQVRRHGEARRYQARVVSVSHAADLALLTVDDPAFFKDVDPLDLGELPRTQQEVLVYGFPLGGDTLSTTKGVISRIEHQTYSHSSCSFLAVQIDAAVNPGNSGGPAIIGDRIVGVAMQGISKADNIGYIVPVPIIRHFLEDIEDGRHDGFPSLGVVLQDMQNRDLKRRFRMPQDRTGMLIVRVIPRSPSEGVLREGDVLLSVEGNAVADDGTVEFRSRERTSVSYCVQQHQIGTSIDLEILRDGEVLPVSLRLTRPLEHDRLIPMDQYDKLPSYYIYGGLVFSPLTVNLLKAWGNNWYDTAPKDLVARLNNNYPEDDVEEVVLLLKVLASDCNQGYHNTVNWVVTEVNGTKVRNLKHLVDLVENGDDDFVVLGNSSGHKVVLDRALSLQSGPQILQTYRIREDRSPDLRDLAPTLPIN